MSAPRTVTILTSDHGPVTIAEPAWCVGGHEDGGYRADILHRGPDVSLAFHGRHITDAGLVQSPFAGATRPGLGGRTTGVSVSVIGKTLNPQGLDELAASLVAYAAVLRHLADELAALLAEVELPPAATESPDPVEALLGMARKLVERLEARTAPWDDVTPGSGSHASTVEQTLNGRTLRLQASIVGAGSEVSQ